MVTVGRGCSKVVQLLTTAGAALLGFVEYFSKALHEGQLPVCRGGSTCVTLASQETKRSHQVCGDAACIITLPS